MQAMLCHKPQMFMCFCSVHRLTWCLQDLAWLHLVLCRRTHDHTLVKRRRRWSVKDDGALRSDIPPLTIQVTNATNALLGLLKREWGPQSTNALSSNSPINCKSRQSPATLTNTHDACPVHQRPDQVCTGTLIRPSLYNSTHHPTVLS